MATGQDLEKTLILLDHHFSVVGQRSVCRVSRHYDSESSKSSHSSKISVDYVNNVLERLKNRQTRESTTNNYLSIWRHLNRFIISLDHKENLCWEEKTALFGAYLVDGGVQSSTLKSYFSAIKHVLRQDGYEWNDRKVLLSSLVRGCGLENDKVKIRLPIQKGLMELLLFELARIFDSDPQPYLKSLYQTMFCLAYYGMLRVGEITDSPHNIKAADVHVGNNKDKILLALYTSKTHGQESGPQKIKISAVSNNTNRHTRFFCPFNLVVHYMSLRGSYQQGIEPFFVYSDRTTPVKPEQFRKILRDTLDAVNLDSSLYYVHSFRSGRTSDLAKFGYSIDQIKAMGRWKSNAVYRYLKN